MVCPECGSRANLQCEPTGGVVFVARPVGTFSLAGAQPKVSAQRVTEYRLACLCGWSTTGYLGQQNGKPHLVETPPGGGQ